MKKTKRTSLSTKWLVAGILCIFLFAVVSVIYVIQANMVRDGGYSFLSDESRRHDLGAPARDEVSSGGQAVAILIDDIGHNLNAVRKLLEIDAPLTFAILPHCAHSRESAEKINSAGREILLHLPMEPHDRGKNPGKGVLTVRMGYAEISALIEESLSEVPHIKGVNNHMGSVFMENEEKVEIVFDILKQKNLFFIDSFTTRASKGSTVAKRTGIKFLSRDIFVENARGTGRDSNLWTMIGKQGAWKKMLVIGHPHPETIRQIQALLPEIRARGINIVSVSELLQERKWN